MNTQLNIYISTILCLMAIINANAQSIGLLAKYKQQEVHLKILPEDSKQWLEGVENGYIISRRELGKDREYQVLNSTPLLPMTELEVINQGIDVAVFDFHIKKLKAVRDRPSLSSIGEVINAADHQDNMYSLYILLTMREKELGRISGLHYVDKTLQSGKVYQYKVSIANTDKASLPIIVDDRSYLKTPTLITASKDQAVLFEWLHEQDSPIAGYYLEKSDTGLNYERINEAPYVAQTEKYVDTLETQKVVTITRVDSLSSNYQSYFYRLVAFDIWGEELAPSEVVKGMGVDVTGPTLGYIEVRVDSVENDLIIDWEPSQDGDVASYFVTLSYTMNGKDSLIVKDLDANGISEYRISDPLELENHYFKLGAIDTSGNISISTVKVGFVPDITPPSQVTDLTYELDSTGVLSLAWSPSEDTNLKGYLVFKSFMENQEFMKITDTVHSANSFQDSCTLNLLNNQRYYYVLALDKSFNPSEPSSILRVQLPDTISPSRTIITDLIQVGDEIKVNWLKSQSEDVINYNIYKKVGDKTEWVDVGIVDFTTTEFIDKIGGAQRILYKIVAVDKSGNESQQNAIKSISTRGINSSETLSLRIKSTEMGALLEWGELGSKYKIYRKKEDRFHLLDYVDEPKYQDKSAHGEYYIKAYDERGRLLSESKIVSI
jgi:hypothetical protein